MAAQFLIGIDFGTASARGVLVDVETGREVGSAVSRYRTGLLHYDLDGGQSGRPRAALHRPADYIRSCLQILSELGNDREIAAVGIAATACSPLAVRDDGSTFEEEYPHNPHALVKLWKHGSSQPYAELVSRRVSKDGRIRRFSGEGLVAKAEETATECPEIWRAAAKYIEVGDWIVWQLTGHECRSVDFASYKACYTEETGYPGDVVEGLSAKLSPPAGIGRVAGPVSPAWLTSTGMKGAPVVAVACIDSHAVLPAVQATGRPAFVGVLGTSSGFLRVGGQSGVLPDGYEAGAYNAAVPDEWCCEAGQAAFGDMMEWFMRTVPDASGSSQGFAWYNDQAACLRPAHGRLLALDWFGGNRVPFADKSLSGLILGLKIETTGVEIYQALVESLAFGVKAIVDYGEADGEHIAWPVFAGTVALENAYLIQTISDVIARPVRVAELKFATAVGAAIHGAVASGVAADFQEGARHFGCRSYKTVNPDSGRTKLYREIYKNYQALAHDPVIKAVMRQLAV